MTSYAGSQFPVRKMDSTGYEGNRRRIQAAKSTGLPLYPWGDLSDHPNGLWIIAGGVVYLRGVDSLTPNQGGVNRTYNERPDAYAVDKDGVPLAALVKVPLEDVQEWDESNAKAEAAKTVARKQAAAVRTEYVNRKNRDYQIARVAGTVANGGVHLPTLRQHLATLGVTVTSGGGSRVLASLPAGPSPHRQEALKYADIAARYGELIVDKKLTCDVARCTRSGDWVTNSGAAVCSKHADR